MKKIGCVGHDCDKCKRGPTKKEMRAAFDAELARMVGKKWVKDHSDDVVAWWNAGIFGGMFRAGVRFARKRSNTRYPANPRDNT